MPFASLLQTCGGVLRHYHTLWKPTARTSRTLQKACMVQRRQAQRDATRDTLHCRAPGKEQMTRGRPWPGLLSTWTRTWSLDSAHPLLCGGMMFAPTSEAPSALLAVAVVIGLPLALWTYKVYTTHVDIAVPR